MNAFNSNFNFNPYYFSSVDKQPIDAFVRMNFWLINKYSQHVLVDYLLSLAMD